MRCSTCSAVVVMIRKNNKIMQRRRSKKMLVHTTRQAVGGGRPWHSRLRAAAGASRRRRSLESKKSEKIEKIARIREGERGRGTLECEGHGRAAEGFSISTKHREKITEQGIWVHTRDVGEILTNECSRATS